MPWFFGEKLEKMGVEITNKLATGNVEVDGKLITGDSPMAANELGKVSLAELVNQDK